MCFVDRASFLAFTFCYILSVAFHFIYYLCEGGYVGPIVVVCLFVCLSVSNFAQKLYWTDLHEICREGWQWANEQMIKFWWRSGSRIQIRICIRIRVVTLVRRSLVEVCTVPVLLAIIHFIALFLFILWSEFCHCHHHHSIVKRKWYWYRLLVN